MISHRTTARGTLVLALALLTLAGGASAAAPQKIVFPVLGTATYIDDFGQPRAGGPHQGIDIMATKRSLALAAEAGKVEFWTHSASAGCMLYLHGASGTDYYYIHLNNDLTREERQPRQVRRRDRVREGPEGRRQGAVAGQPVGYVGDSGDANGIHAHLHFELHPGRGAAIDPYPWLQRATHLLFSAPRGMPFTLELRGTIVSVTDDAVQLKLAAVSAWPMRQHQSQLKRRLLVTRAGRRDGAARPEARRAAERRPTSPRRSRSSRSSIWTAAAPTTLKAQRGDDLALSASLVSLVGS